MKKLLSILLAAMLLCGVMSVGLSASAASGTSLLLKPLTDFIASYDLGNLTDVQIDTLVGMLRTLKTLGIDYTVIIEAAETYLSAAAKEALRLAGLIEIPVADQVKATDLPGLTKQLTDFLSSKDLGNLTDAQLDILIKLLSALKAAGINYAPFIESVDSYLPFTVKAALHNAGLMNYPIWERDATMYFIFRYLLFGWIWMEQGQSSNLLLSLLGQLI